MCWSFIACLELAHTDDNPFKEFIADRVISTQLDLLRLLKDGGVNSKIGGVNSRSESFDGGVNSLEDELLQAIQITPGLNAPALAITLNKSLRTIQRHLKSISDKGKIEFKGASKNGGYYPKS